VKALFSRWVLARPTVAFAVMTLAFLGFGAGTLNLFMLLGANLSLLAAHGWQAALDGGLRQLVELLLSALASMGAWLVFKTCEFSLVRRLANEGP
jgi:hypothetical protein